MHYNRRRCMSNIHITVSQIKRAIVIYQKYDRRGYESPSVYGPLDRVKSLTSRVRRKLYRAVEGIEVIGLLREAAHKLQSKNVYEEPC